MTPPKNADLIMTRAEALSLACLRVTQLAVRVAVGIPTPADDLNMAFVGLDFGTERLASVVGNKTQFPVIPPTATWETCTHDGASGYQTFAALGQRVTLLSAFNKGVYSWSILVDMNPVAETSHLDGAYALGQLIVDGLAVRKARLDK